MINIHKPHSPAMQSRLPALARAQQARGASVYYANRYKKGHGGVRDWGTGNLVLPSGRIIPRTACINHYKKGPGYVRDWRTGNLVLPSGRIISRAVRPARPGLLARIYEFFFE